MWPNLLAMIPSHTDAQATKPAAKMAQVALS
jgi:hypothetical protein